MERDIPLCPVPSLSDLFLPWLSRSDPFHTVPYHLVPSRSFLSDLFRPSLSSSIPPPSSRPFCSVPFLYPVPFLSTPFRSSLSRSVPLSRSIPLSRSDPLCRVPTRSILPRTVLCHHVASRSSAFVPPFSVPFHLSASFRSSLPSSVPVFPVRSLSVPFQPCLSRSDPFQTVP